MDNQLEIHKIFSCLKRIFKDQNIKYRMIAEETGLSLSSVKRILANEECSLSQLSQFCSIAGLTLEKVVRASAKMEAPTFQLSEKAAKFFAENMNYFFFYRQLQFQKGNTDALAKDNELDDRSILLYLKKLESLGLIERHPNEKIKILGHGYLKFPPDSKLNRNIVKNWLPSVLERILNKNGTDGHFVEVSSTGLSTNSSERLKQDIVELVKKYRELGSFDQTIFPDKASSVGMFFGFGPYRIGDGVEIPRLQ